MGFKNHDGLIGARHHGFGDGDQLFLLAEDAQPRRLRLTAIELASSRREAARCGPAESAQSKC